MTDESELKPVAWIDREDLDRLKRQDDVFDVRLSAHTTRAEDVPLYANAERELAAAQADGDRMLNAERKAHIETSNQAVDLALKLHRIKQWCDAYPLAVFPEPDFQKAQRLLSAGGMTIDAISASNMRHVLDGVRKIIDMENP